MYVQVSVIVLTVLYGLVYAMMNPAEFGFKSLIDPFYFSFTTMASVGYGDFSPKTTRAKMHSLWGFLASSSHAPKGEMW